MKNLKEHIIGKPRLAYDGKIIKVYNETVETPGGDTAHRDIVHHAKDVVALVLDNNNQMILEKQWREPVKQVTIETPAGKVDSRDHGSSRHAMMRELNEEVRLKPERLIHVSGGYSSTGMTDEYMDFYIAKNVQPVNKKLPRDKGEYIHLFSVPLSHALGLVQIGKIKDVKTILAIEYWRNQVLAMHYRRSQFNNLMVPITLLHKAIMSLKVGYKGIMSNTINKKRKGTDLFTHICAYPVMVNNAFNNLKLFRIIPSDYIKQACIFINKLAQPKNTIQWHKNNKAKSTKNKLIAILEKYQRHYRKIAKPFHP